MRATTLTIKNKFKLFIVLFCYIFAFYLGGISVSILLGLFLWVISLFRKRLWNNCIEVASSNYIKKVFIAWLFIVIFSSCFPIIFLTFDFTFCRIVYVQLIHIFAAIPVFAWLKYKNISHNDVEHYCVYIFIIQTFIQIIVLSVPQLGSIIHYFNHYNPDSVVGLGQGIRGKALSAATTYHLTMAYGIAFIIYIKLFFKKNISLINILVGISLFVGIFFAGRTGFVGCLIGAIGFIMNSQIQATNKRIMILKTTFLLIISISSIYSLIYTFAPDFYSLLNEQILPYAFEFLYSLDSSGEMETASTNHLMQMWNSDFKISELILGSGKYSNPDGTYYMHVDPGIIRHLLYMGVFGYCLLIAYQLTLLPVWKFRDKNTKYYYSLILLFLFIMEFKCVNIGINKFAFSISLLLSYSYLYLSKDEKNPNNLSIPTIK